MMEQGSWANCSRSDAVMEFKAHQYLMKPSDMVLTAKACDVAAKIGCPTGIVVAS